MQPLIALDPGIVRANARAIRERAGVPVRAVIKADGYGWGFASLVQALRDDVQAFCVADMDEFRVVRRLTTVPIVILSTVSVESIDEVVACDATFTVCSLDQIRAVQAAAKRVGREPRVRIGLRPALAWSGNAVDEIVAFADELAVCKAQVELWTHLTDPLRDETLLHAFDDVHAELKRRGVRVVATDVSSSFPLARVGAHGSAVRVGVALFGAVAALGVRCAIEVAAPVVRRESNVANMDVGYGASQEHVSGSIAIVRCGYADGFPATGAGFGKIVSVGMQYAVVRETSGDRDDARVKLLDASSDFDAFCTHAGRLPHDVVSALGNASFASATRRRR